MGHPFGKPAWNKGLKVKYSDKGIENMRKSMQKMRANYKIKITCQKCGTLVIGHTPRRKFCDNCTKTKPQKINYRRREWLEARKKTIERDKGVCQLCNLYIGESIDVHHIDENGYRKNGIENKSANNNLNNLICLCHHCHQLITSVLRYKKFMNIDIYNKLIWA